MKEETKKLAYLLVEWGESPIKFIEDMWGLTPQPLKLEYENVAVASLSDIKADWFEPFVKGKHITWQQWVILLAFEAALNGGASKRISVRSGHGIGKDALSSWLVLWYLMCFEDSQIPCTAPTSDQLYDILWKEIAVWLRKMPPKYQDLYEWSTAYVRMKVKPESWFARARTGRKENPEALAGVHGEHVFLIIDEASGVDETVFTTMEGALTGQDILVLMISNPTRLIGYFYDSHHKDRQNWQCLNFDSRTSPIVEDDYVKRIIGEFGEESDEYKIKVAGEFPKADAVDDKGFVPLLLEEDIHWAKELNFVGDKRMGVDPSGEGDDETIWCVRDKFRAKVTAREQISNEKSIAQKTLTQMDYFVIKDSDVTIDNFGTGANVSKEIALATGANVYSVNVGEHAQDMLRFQNKRAEAYFRMRNWMRGGGEIVPTEGIKEELLSIRYRRMLSGKIEIMGKQEMRKNGIKSPNQADALALTFVKGEPSISDASPRVPGRSKLAGMKYMH